MQLYSHFGHAYLINCFADFSRAQNARSMGIKLKINSAHEVQSAGEKKKNYSHTILYHPSHKTSKNMS